MARSTAALPRKVETTVTRVGDPGAADDSGRLLLRLAIGVLMLLHGVAKLRTGVDPIAGLLSKQGLPGEIAPLVYLGEVVAPLLVIIGLWTRPAALVIAVTLLVAIGLAHGDDVLRIGEQGGWAIELQALYLFGALAVALLGAGRYSLGGRTGAGSGVMSRWN